MENSIPSKRKRCHTSLLKGVPQHGNTGRISQWTPCVSHLWTHYHLNNITWYKCRHDGWETQWPWNLSAFLTFVHVMFLRWLGVHKCETQCSQQILQTINGESTGIRKETHLIHGFINIYGFFNFRVFFFTFSLSVKEKLFDVSLDFSNTAGLQSKWQGGFSPCVILSCTSIIDMFGWNIFWRT